MFVGLLASCSSPTRLPIPSPAAPIIYEYQYEVVNTRSDCEPDNLILLETDFRLLLIGISTERYEDYEEAASVLRQAVECTKSEIQTHLSGMGDNSWNIVSFETQPPIEGEVGIQFLYRIVWERPK